MKKRRLHPGAIFAVIVFLLLLGFGLVMREGNNSTGWTPRIGWNDDTPLGGKGWRMLLEHQGYRLRRVDRPLKQMPNDAQVWMLLDPLTRFSQSEASMLLKWVQDGHTLIWADTSSKERSELDSKAVNSPALNLMREKLGLQEWRTASFKPRAGLPLPPLVPLGDGDVNPYRTDANGASASAASVFSSRANVQIFGNRGEAQLMMIPYGKGRVFLMADALLWTNMALSKAPNTILATNLIRAHHQPGATIIWDERQHDAATATEVKPNVLYYLWRPPLRWAVLQVLAGLLLLWAFKARRLGRAVPLPVQEPVTRASQWALAMASLFQKAERPQSAAATTGEEFRRQFALRLGCSPADSDATIVARAAMQLDIPASHLDHLLLRARTPSENPAQMLRDAQEMELLLRTLRR